MTAPIRDALIVGGSLVGLAAAIRIARCGINVCVLERGEAFAAEGAGLGINRRQLSQVAGVSATGGSDMPALPVIASSRESTTWNALYRWLRTVAVRDDRIAIRPATTVTGVVNDDRGRVLTQDGPMDADFVLGADGRASIVRPVIAPERPLARYARYGLWRGLVEESALPAGTFPVRPYPVAVHWAEGQRLVAYQTPDLQGRVQPGFRAVSWGWYDRDLTELFAARGCVRGDEVVRSLRPHELSGEMAMLRARASALWPQPWRAAILATIDAGRVFATPIAEYLPVRLAAGRLAIAGDAAHLASPVMGSGLATGLDDVDALGRALEAEAAGGPPALAAYDAERLQSGRALVLQSMRWSQAYWDDANI